MPEHIQGNSFLRGQDGDARRGTCYGHRSAKEYNRVKVRATEREEGRKVVFMYYARKLQNDNKILEFVVINGHFDPGMKVISRVPKTFMPLTITGDPRRGTVQLVGKELMEEWVRTEEDGKYVFHAPPSYDGGPISWFHQDLGDEPLVYESDKVFMIPDKRKPTEDVALTEVSSSTGALNADTAGIASAN